RGPEKPQRSVEEEEPFVPRKEDVRPGQVPDRLRSRDREGDSRDGSREADREVTRQVARTRTLTRPQRTVSLRTMPLARAAFFFEMQNAKCKMQNDEGILILHFAFCIHGHDP